MNISIDWQAHAISQIGISKCQRHEKWLNLALFNGLCTKHVINWVSDLENTSQYQWLIRGIHVYSELWAYRQGNADSVFMYS